MPVRRRTTTVAALTLMAATVLGSVGVGPASAMATAAPHDVVHVSAVATAPCPAGKADQRSAAARADAKAAQAAAKQADAVAKAAKRAVAAAARTGAAQQPARKAQADKAALRAAQAARAAQVLAARASKAADKASRTRNKAHCGEGPLTVSTAAGAAS